MQSDSPLGSLDQVSPDVAAHPPRNHDLDRETYIRSLPNPLANIDSEILDKLSLTDSLQLVAGKSVCLAEPLNVVGLHRVTLIRLSGHYADEFYLDDPDLRDAFIVAAVRKLCRPEEDPSAMGQGFRQAIGEKLTKYEQATNHVVIEPLSKVMPAEVQWLWPGYLAADKLAVLVGEPGVGKTLTALDIAARVTTGAPWPTDPPGTGRREPASVILLSEMDDSSDTLCPRLEAVGADLSRVHLVRTYVEAGDAVAALPFSVGGNLDMLASCVDRVSDCRLIIIDPLSLYVEGSLNRSQITQLLGYLIELAVDQEVAILVVSHFGRSQFHYASHLTAKFVAAARTVWRILDDGQDHGRRVLLPVKNNLGADRHGLAFRIVEESDVLFPAPRVAWEAKQSEVAVQRSTYDLEKVKGPVVKGSRERQRVSVRRWLKSQLMRGGMLAENVKQAAKQEHIGIKMLRRALDEIGGISHRGPTGHYLWFLPETLSLAQKRALGFPLSDDEKRAGTQDFRELQELQDFQHMQATRARPNVDAAA